MIMQPMYHKSLTQAGAKVLSEWQPVIAGKKKKGSISHIVIHLL